MYFFFLHFGSYDERAGLCYRTSVTLESIRAEFAAGLLTTTCSCFTLIFRGPNYDFDSGPQREKKQPSMLSVENTSA